MDPTSEKPTTLLEKYPLESAPVVVGPLHVSFPIVYQMHPTFEHRSPILVQVYREGGETRVYCFPIVNHWGEGLDKVFGLFQFMYFYLLDMARRQPLEIDNVTVDHIDFFIRSMKMFWVGYEMQLRDTLRYHFQSSLMKAFTAASPARSAKDILEDYVKYDGKAQDVMVQIRVLSTGLLTALHVDSPQIRRRCAEEISYATAAAHILAQKTAPFDHAEEVAKNFENWAGVVQELFSRRLITEQYYAELFTDLFMVSSPSASAINILEEIECARRIVKNENILAELMCTPQILQILSENSESCVVCITPYAPEDEVCTTPCGHAFHIECFRKHAFDKRRCILCRGSIYPCL